MKTDKILGPIAMATVWGLFPLIVAADPVLSVSTTGIHVNGNLEWLIELAPDANLFSTTPAGFGGSLAVELALEVTGSDLVSADVNGAAWPSNVESIVLLLHHSP